jgi:signal transduction histidine kinase
MAETGVVLSTARVRDLITDDRTLHRWRLTRSLLGLAVLTVVMVRLLPHPATSVRGVAMLAAIVLAAAAWLAMALRGNGPSVAVCGACGVVLQVLAPHSYAPAYLIAAGLAAAQRLSLRTGGAVVAVLVAAQSYVQYRSGADLSTIVSLAFAVVVTFLLSHVRALREGQARQVRALAAETELARQEQARAAVLAERARLAREIHDVLAHSLSALSVQLETAAALLERDRAAEAAAVVDRAGRLTRDGLAETRRAVGALRGDPLPLPELVTALADDAGVEVTGEPRPLPAEAGLAIYRGAQEALTNARKHAHASSVQVTLWDDDSGVRLSVVDDGIGLPADDVRPDKWPHLGLETMRDRAHLAGGTLTLRGSAQEGTTVDMWLPSIRPAH